MKNKKPNAELVWKQLEDLLAPRLRLSVIDRTVYSHLLRHSRLEGKLRLRFSLMWLGRNIRLSTGPVREAAGDLKRLVGEILAPRYGNIWLVGGAMLGQSFLRLGLVDEIRLMIAPVTLGDGLHLFGDSGTEQKWHLKNVIAYKNGFVELSYRRQSTDRTMGADGKFPLS